MSSDSGSPGVQVFLEVSDMSILQKSANRRDQVTPPVLLPLGPTFEEQQLQRDPYLLLWSPSLGKGSGPWKGTRMARLSIGCEAPCERCWLVGGTEEEAVSRVTGGQGAAAAVAVVEERELRAVRDPLEAAARQSRVGAQVGATPVSPLRGPGWARLPGVGTGRGKFAT